ncbi:MAG TPA: hypothetical protein VGD17_15250 [Chitinophagaceae bacterium]
MQKLITIFFLFIFSVSVTEAGQLLKLPLLIEHYIDHSERGKANSFLGFLQEHYQNDHKDDGDESEDSSLPFKTLTNSIVSLNFLSPESEEINTLFTLSTTDHQLHPEPFLFKDPLSGVFHPPRIA